MLNQVFEARPSLFTGALPEAESEGVARAFKALGDPVRLRLFSMIASAGAEICVCELTGAFDLTAPTISHHLKVLREAGLVESQRRGTWVHYWAVPERAESLAAMLTAGAAA